ncbi:MAG: hypothetical protein KAH20_12505 [Methylococcales bacterium]|nr:hypothetical protein [Methylococcales bacterium]
MISGVPTVSGVFHPIIKRTDADGNTATITLNYTVIDAIAPPNLRAGFISHHDDSFSVYSNQSNTGTIRTYGQFNGSDTDSFDFSIANDGGAITHWEMAFDQNNSVRYCEIVINTGGYFCHTVGFILGTAFTITINQVTGLVNVIWPMSNINTVSYRLDIEALEATLTASNASGSSTRKIRIAKSNGNPASNSPHGTEPNNPSTGSIFSAPLSDLILQGNHSVATNDPIEMMQ